MGLKHFFTQLLHAMASFYFWLIALFAYLLGYPSPILIMCLVLFVLDIFTRIYAICINNGGLAKAFFIGKISSRGFWVGFITKTIGYFVVLTIANFAIITPEISYIGKGIASVLYLALFFYETISVFENLRDAGFLAIIPVLNKIKQEQDEFLKKDIKKNKMG